MTLVWIYLALCAFCCSLKRAATPHRISPRSPGGSPVSPSRSSAPLRRAGDKRSSPRSYPGDDEYADGGIEMGGGGGRGGAPGSPYGLGRAASWERERRRYSFRCLYVCSGLFSAILLVCVLGVFAAQSKFDGACPLCFVASIPPNPQFRLNHHSIHSQSQARCACWRERPRT